MKGNYKFHSYPQETILKQMYDSDMSIAEMGRHLGINAPALRYHIKKYCPSIKPRIGTKPKYKTIIPKKMSKRWAYILGLIVSDGCIASTSKELIFQQKDHEICTYVRDFLSPTRPTKQINQYWRLTICSKALCKMLINMGIGPRKAKTVSLPNVPPIFQRHLLRGVFDGDGTVYITDNGYTLTIRIGTSSPKLIDDLVYLYNKWGIAHKVRLIEPHMTDSYQKSNHWIIQTYTEASLSLYKQFYQDATLFLSRKKKIFDQFIADYADRQYPQLEMPPII